ncbi:MAG: PD-(D/E)XK nuclease family protein [bacterium]
MELVKIKKIKELTLSTSFIKLTNYTEKFNIFKIMKIENKEIIHSNILAKLLNPNYSHGISNTFMKEFIKKVQSDISPNIYSRLINSLPNVYREKYFIDIILEFSQEKVVIAIENKINAPERENQLSDYQKKLEKQYTDHLIILMFLTPYGRESVSNNIKSKVVVRNLSYSDICEMCKKIVREDNTPVNFFLKQFIEHLEEDIMEKTETYSLCKEIYKKHPDAYRIMVEQYNTVRNNSIKSMFDQLKDNIIDNKEINVNIKYKTEKISKDNPYIYLDIRNVKWPKGIVIKIYKGHILGVFPMIYTNDLTESLYDYLSFEFKVKPTEKDWGGITYFTKDLVNAIKPDQVRCIKNNVNKIDMDDIYRAYNRFLEIYDDINSKLIDIEN